MSWLFRGRKKSKRKRTRTLRLSKLESRRLLSGDGVLGLDHDDHDHDHNHDHDHDEPPEFLIDSRGTARFFDPPYYASPGEGWLQGSDDPQFASDATDSTSTLIDAGTTVPISEVPALNSNPGAPNVLYLDFDGQIIEKTDWNLDNNDQPIHAEPFDIDGDRTTWSQEELEAIREVWLRVSEDFLPFDINVTTIEPDAEALGNPRGAIRAMITTNFDDAEMGGTGDRWHTDVGGVAYTNSWIIPDQTPVWVFYNLLPPNAKGIAEAATHEFGHSFGLVHHGVGDNEYYEGHGEGETSWAPIMGTGYTSNVTQWSNGEYDNASRDQDDFSLITESVNRILFREDDIWEGSDFAQPITVEDGVASAAGEIAEAWDYDTFSLEHPGGPINLHIAPAEIGPNLDVMITLFDSDEDEIATFDPVDYVDVWIQTDLPAGTYYLDVEGGKFLPDQGQGYSDYGSVGAYSISGYLGVPPLTVLAGGEYGWQEGGQYRIEQGNAVSFDASLTFGPSETIQFAWDLDGDGIFDDANGANPSLTWEELLAANPDFGNGNNELTVQATDDLGNVAVGNSTLYIRNLRPTIEEVPPQEVPQKTRTKFEVQASDFGDDVLTYEWKVYSIGVLGTEEQIVATDGSEDAFFHYAFDEPGEHEVRVRVTDEDGGTQVETIPVTVLDTLPLPRIVESSITDGTTVASLSSVTFSLNQDVSAELDVSNLVIFDSQTNFPIDLENQEVVWNADDFTAEFSFTPLPTGNYIVTVERLSSNDQILDGNEDGIPGGRWVASVSIAEAPAGDINGDGSVDFTDFLILSQNFGKEQDAIADEGDLDGDGRIDFADFLLLAQSFGT